MDVFQAKKAEIARRYKRRGKRQVSLIGLRVRELNRLLTARYGDTLPNDDAGRDDVAVVAHHLASLTSGNPVQRIRSWVSLRAPWYPIGDLEELIRDALTNPRRWTADRLAWRMRLTAVDRKALRITTIGAIDLARGSRLAQRRERARLAKEAKRRKEGRKPRHQYEAASVRRARPWQALGISRATWYRQRRRET